MTTFVTNDIPAPAAIRQAFAVCLMEFGNGSTQFTRHEIDMSGAAPLLKAGTPFTYGDLQALVEILQDRKKEPSEIGVLPPELLFSSAARTIWYRRGSVRPMWFTGPKGGAIRLNVPWPNLIFDASAAGLFIFAYKGNRRPTVNTPLSHAPLMNVYDNGNVCLGSADAPKNAEIESMAGWETVIYDTLFSHTNHPDTLRTGKKPGRVSNAAHLRFYRGLSRAKAARFPSSALVPTGTTLGEYLRGTEG